MLKFEFTRSSEYETVRVIIDGKFYSATKGQHPNYEEIENRINAGRSDVLELFNLEKVLQDKFTALTPKVSIKNSIVHYNYEPLGEVISDVVIDAHERGDKFEHLVKFVESISLNPGETSADSLYTWLAGKNVTFLPDGRFIGYKSVHKLDLPPDDKQRELYGNHAYKSVHSGNGNTDGVDYKNQQLPQSIGSIVSMDRAEVDNNAAIECSTGLHIAGWNYANNFTGKTILAIAVAGEDVAAVPTGDNAQKMRAVKYQVLGEVTQEYPAGLLEGVYETV